MAIGTENKTVTLQYLSDTVSKIGGRRTLDSEVVIKVTWLGNLTKEFYKNPRLEEEGWKAKVIIVLEPNLTPISTKQTRVKDEDGNLFSIGHVSLIPTGFGVDGSYVFLVKETEDRD